MKKKSKKVKSKNNFLKKIFLEITNIRVEEILFIILSITGILLILGFLHNKELLSVYYIGITLTPSIYFDVFIRNGVFKYLYFAFVIAFVYWLAKKIIKTKLDIKTGIIVVVAGLVIAFLIYLAPPYYLEETEPVPGSFWSYPTESDINITNHPGCGDRIDFIFTPSSQQAIRVLPEIESLREQGIPINIYCIDRWINDKILCKQNYGLDTREGDKLLKEIGMKKMHNPILLIGCKYWIDSMHNASVTKAFICDQTDVC